MRGCFRKRVRSNIVNCRQVDVVRDWNRAAVFVFVFNMSGTMRVFRHVNAPATRQRFRISINGTVIEKKLHELDSENVRPGIPVHEVDFSLDGVFFYNASPEDVIIWGPFYNLDNTMFYFERKRGLTVHNMSGRVVLDGGYETRALFKDKYLPCLQRGNSIFENVVHIYHISGNLQHHERSDSVFFKGFRLTKDVSSLVHEMAEPRITQSGFDVRMNMFVASCNLGVYVDMSEINTMTFMMNKLYGIHVHFMQRHEQNMNVVIFNVNDVPGFLPMIDPRWTYGCTCMNCTVTRKGVMVVRLSWCPLVNWTECFETMTIKALDMMMMRVLECV